MSPAEWDKAVKLMKSLWSIPQDAVALAAWYGPNSWLARADADEVRRAIRALAEKPPVTVGERNYPPNSVGEIAAEVDRRRAPKPVPAPPERDTVRGKILMRLTVEAVDKGFAKSMGSEELADYLKNQADYEMEQIKKPEREPGCDDG